MEHRIWRDRRPQGNPFTKQMDFLPGYKMAVLVEFFDVLWLERKEDGATYYIENAFAMTKGYTLYDVREAYDDAEGKWLEALKVMNLCVQVDDARVANRDHDAATKQVRVDLVKQRAAFRKVLERKRATDAEREEAEHGVRATTLQIDAIDDQIDRACAAAPMRVRILKPNADRTKLVHVDTLDSNQGRFLTFLRSGLLADLPLPAEQPQHPAPAFA
jgi:hypothetical protein